MKPDVLRSARQRTNRAIYWSQLQLDAWRQLHQEPERMARLFDVIEVENSYAATLGFHLWSAYQHWLHELAVIQGVDQQFSAFFFAEGFLTASSFTDESLVTPCPQLSRLAAVLEKDGRVSPDVVYLQQLSQSPDSWLSRLRACVMESVLGRSLDRASDLQPDSAVSHVKLVVLSVGVQRDFLWDVSFWQSVTQTFQSLVVDARASFDDW